MERAWNWRLTRPCERSSTRSAGAFARSGESACGTRHVCFRGGEPSSCGGELTKPPGEASFGGELGAY